MEFVEYIKSPRIEKVLLKRRGCQYIEGTLCVTGHHLIFSSRTEESDELIVSTSAISLVDNFCLWYQRTLMKMIHFWLEVISQFKLV